MKLDGIRLRRATRGELPLYKTQANEQYTNTFQEEGLATVHDQPAAVAMRVRTSAVRGALVAAIDDWSVCLTDKEQRLWLAEIARQADPDSAGWRERILDPKIWDDPVALTELAKTVPVDGQPVSLLLSLGERLRAAGGEPEALLKRVQKEHPADFWANLILGNVILQREPREASGYYRAALASRPQDAVGYCAVGDALRLQHLPSEAAEYYQKALRLDPRYARAYGVLGLASQEQGQVDEAIKLYQHAVELDPDYAWAHSDLANALRGKGQFDEAYEHSRLALRLDPMNVEARKCLTCVLFRKERGPEALADWRQALAAHNPSEPEVWNGFAELCLFLGHEEEYRRVRRDLLARFGETPSPYYAEPLGRCCLLLPGTEDELQQAVALADRAVAAKDTTPVWIYRYFLFAKSLAEYRQGHFASAITMLKGDAGKVMGPSPKLIVAMAQFRQGKQKQARKTLAAAISSADWSAPQAEKRDVWINHILRREAEALILPNLTAFLQGTYCPRDNDERLALLGVCQFQGLNSAAAQLYADAFATDSTLADNLAAEHRYRAARFAARVGCGLSKDGVKVDDAERTRWRKQAREWLKADLASRAMTLVDGSEAVHHQVEKMLMRWQSDPDLAGVREASALEKLSVDEREGAQALWKEVTAVLQRAQEVK
jgi:eukaryotic-like serine/threonine-protein kinase